jgi:hypothetical protein
VLVRTPSQRAQTIRHGAEFSGYLGVAEITRTVTAMQQNVLFLVNGTAHSDLRQAIG